LTKEIGDAWTKVEGDAFPTVAMALEPEHVAQRAVEILLDHYKRTGKELAPSEVFATMEEELAPLRQKMEKRKPASVEKKAQPPERVRSVKSESPQARETSRPTEDVTRRVTREPSAGRSLSLDRDSLRERLIAKAREAAH
jgi:hypothetical protein